MILKNIHYFIKQLNINYNLTTSENISELIINTICEIHKLSNKNLINVISKHPRYLIIAKKFNYTDSLIYDLSGTLLFLDKSNNCFKFISTLLPKGNVCDNSVFLKKKLENENIIKIIYPVLNMTHIALYYFDNKWCMASQYSIDIADNIYYKSTFQDILSSILKKVSNDIFSFDILNKNFSYLFAFNHKEIHYLTQKKEIYLIDIFQHNIYPNEIIESNESTNSSELISSELIDIQKGVLTCLNIPELIPENILKFSVVDYDVSAENVNNLYCFGITVFMENNYYTFETKFYKFMKKMVYSIPQDIQRDKIPNFLVLRANLNYIHNARFIKIFPEYLSEYEKITNIKYKIIELLIENNKTKKRKEISVDDKTQRLFEYFFYKFKSEYYSVDYNLVDTKKILFDCISDMTHLTIYYKILYC